jgi:hypothetical protein
LLARVPEDRTGRAGTRQHAAVGLVGLRQGHVAIRIDDGDGSQRSMCSLTPLTNRNVPPRGERGTFCLAVMPERRRQSFQQTTPSPRSREGRG